MGKVITFTQSFYLYAELKFSLKQMHTVWYFLFNEAFASACITYLYLDLVCHRLLSDPKEYTVLP